MHDRAFTRRWVTANAVFFAIGIALGAFHYPVDAEPGCHTLVCGGYGLALGALTGATVGLAQWYLLAPLIAWPRSSQPQENRKPGIFSWWLAATSAGFAIGHALGDSGVLPIVDLPFSAVLYGIVSGLIVGGSQAIVLRRYVSGTLWWIAGSTVGFSVGLSLFGFLSYAFVGSRPDSFYEEYPFILPLLGLLEGVLLGWMYGISTNWAMRRLEEQERSASANPR
jgi:hypothetical protein